MKKLFLLALVGLGMWWHFVGGTRISEAQVNDFYEKSEHALLTRDPDAMCALLADNFKSDITLYTMGYHKASTANKAETCADQQRLVASWELLGKSMGGMVQLDHTYEIHKITISPDKKTATVEVGDTLDVAGFFMRMQSEATDTLIRKNGRVYVLKSEGELEISTRMQQGQ